jgi:hypothetical protein
VCASGARRSTTLCAPPALSLATFFRASGAQVKTGYLLTRLWRAVKSAPAPRQRAALMSPRMTVIALAEIECFVFVVSRKTAKEPLPKLWTRSLTTPS